MARRCPSLRGGAGRLVESSIFPLMRVAGSGPCLPRSPAEQECCCPFLQPLGWLRGCVCRGLSSLTRYTGTNSFVQPLDAAVSQRGRTFSCQHAHTRCLRHDGQLCRCLSLSGLSLLFSVLSASLLSPLHLAAATLSPNDFAFHFVHVANGGLSQCSREHSFPRLYRHRIS